MNKFWAMSLIFIILTIFMGVGFATTPTWGSSTIEISPNIENSASDTNVIFTCSGCADTNYLCAGLTDTNTSSTCIATNDTNTISLNSFNLSLTEGSKTIYFFLKNTDGNYSTDKNDTFTLDTTGPTVIVTGVTNGNYYDTNNFSIDFNVSDSDLNYFWITYSGTGDTNYYDTNTTYTLTDLNDGTYTITVDANDSFNNSEDANTITFYVDTITPILNSASATTSWTNDTTPTITLDINETNPNKAYFSCSNTGPWSEKNYSSTINSFNIKDTDYNCSTSDGNRTIYVKISDKVDKNSNIVDLNIALDTTNPSAPSGLSATANDSSVYLSWTAPTTADNNSGNNTYHVLTRQGSTTINDVNIAISSTSTTIGSLTNGTTYTFRVSTIDNAGNESTYIETTKAPVATNNDDGSDTTSAPTSEASIKKGSEIVEYVKNDDNLTAICSYSIEVDNARIYYKYYNPDEEQQTLKGPTNDVSSLSENLTVNGTNEKIGFWCYGTSENGNTTSSINYVYIDNTQPSIEWKTLPTKYIGKVNISVTATDNKSLKIPASTGACISKYKSNSMSPKPALGFVLSI